MWIDTGMIVETVMSYPIYHIPKTNGGQLNPDKSISEIILVVRGMIVKNVMSYPIYHILRKSGKM